MELTAVVEVLDALDGAGVRHSVVGGWGVDALVGRQTREHRDLDLLVDDRDWDTCLDVLAGLGYVPETDWMPIRLELAAPGRGWVDAHPVVMDARGNGVQAGPDGSTYDYPHACFSLGSLDGRPVPCVTAGLQRSVHSGYDPRPQDLHDLAVLADLDE